MRLSLAIVVCKFTNKISQLLGREGTVIGGYAARKVYKNCLRDVVLPKYVIGVTGSSGKGSTTQLVAHMLDKNNIKYAYNKNGSNVFDAIISLILSNCKLNGEFKGDALLMELDEKHSVSLIDYIELTHLVITNITRDQPPRNTHPEYIQSIIGKIIQKDTHLIINADDPLVYQLSLNHPGNVTYYGLLKNNYSSLTNINNVDAGYCPICGKKLAYKYYHYGHLGNYYCTGCEFKRPKLDYEVHNINIDKELIKINKNSVRISSNFMYSVYFTAASYALCSVLGFSEERIDYALNVEAFKPKRLNVYKFNNRKLQMVSSKNENNLSYKQSLDYIIHADGVKTIILGFDNSSRRYKENDISWLWDIDFEQLRHKSISSIIVVGRFKYDVLTRLKYAGIDEARLLLVEELDNDLVNVLNRTKGTIYTMVCFDKESEIKNIMLKEGMNNDN